MTLVLDAAAVVAALLDTGPAGRWAEALIARSGLAAPSLLQVEVAATLRRSALAGVVSQDLASLAHQDLLVLPVELFPYEPFADRVWELRDTVTPYDAWYVAVAEALDAPLATLDQRLVRAPGPRCSFVTPT